jgi:mannobiose 2-epimerase
MTGPSEDCLAAGARRELLENILPFWRRYAVDEKRGGFIAEMSNDLRLQESAAKGLILNARILWTFSAAARYTQHPEDRSLAERAYDYMTRCFLDPEHGGYFWELDPQGHVLDDRKKIYGQAFCVYALAEFQRAFDQPGALRQAVDLFRLMETHSRDAKFGGYFEVLARDWRLCENMRLSDQDMNEKKSMNNQLHVLEAYTNLLRSWPDPLLVARLRELIDIFQRRILNAGQAHFHHFFDEAWTPKSDSYTFGHDIEGSWLLCEAAEVLGDNSLLVEVQALAVRIARGVLEEGLDTDGGLSYEGRAGRIIRSDREWWTQAEAVVGFLNAWQLTRDGVFLDAAERCWQYIQDRIVDHTHGEWFWRVNRDGVPEASLPKVSAWKCPYHNGRCCLEILQRTRTDLHPREKK